MNDTRRPRCLPVAEALRFPQVTLGILQFDGTNLVVELQRPGLPCARLLFRDVIGFRVLDERDLLEFWPEFATPAGWLWRVVSGGWHDLERTRATFDGPHWYDGALEHLLVDDKCVSVLSCRPPEFVEVEDSPMHA